MDLHVDCLLYTSSDDGVGVATADMMKAAMQKCRDVDGIIAAHTEDMSYRKPNACMHEGIRSKQLGLTLSLIHIWSSHNTI